MIARYAIKKFLKVFFWTSLFFSSIFFLFQITSVQNNILNFFLEDTATIELIETSGLFPFNFSIRKVNIKSPDFSASIDNLHIRTSSNFLEIKKLSATSINIKTLTQTNNISFDDLGISALILNQKFIKNISIKNLDINGFIFQKIAFVSNDDIKINFIKFNTSNGEINSTIKTNDGNFSADIKYIDSNSNNLNLQIDYGLESKHLSIGFFRNNENEAFFDGIYAKGCIKGGLNIKKLNTVIASSFSLHDSCISSIFYSKLFKVSGSLEYSLPNNSLTVGNVVFDNGTVLKPFILTSDMKIDNIDVLFKKGKINITGINLSEENFSLGTTKIENIDISQFQSDKDKLEGSINGTILYKNKIEDVKLHLKNLSLGNLKFPDINIVGSYSKDLINLKAFYKMLNKNNEINFSVKADNWLINKNSDIKLKANGAFSLTDYIRIKDQVIKGNLKYSISSLGTVGDPIFSGTINFKNGVYMNPSSGTYIKDATILTDIKNNKILVTKLYAIDESNSQGTISGNGNILLTKNGIITDILFNFNNFEIIELKNFEGKLFGKLNLSGTSEQGFKLCGELYTNNAGLDVSNLIEASSHALDLVEKKAETKQKMEQKPDVKCLVDIKFYFKPNLHIKGCGIDSNWGGGATISGDINDLSYEGKVTLIDGIIKVSGKKLALQNGTISISKKNHGVFLVDVSAVKAIDHIKVGARFVQNEKGNDVTFFSNPYVSKNDILSYLLFDKKSSEITAGEGLTIFSIMSKISGGSDFDITEKIKTVFGFDTIEIKKNKTSSGTEYDAMSIGKSIGKLKVSVDQGAGKDTTSVIVEADIMKNTKLNVNLSGTDSVGGGIIWRKRY